MSEIMVYTAHRPRLSSRGTSFGQVENVLVDRHVLWLAMLLERAGFEDGDTTREMPSPMYIEQARKIAADETMRSQLIETLERL